MQVEIDITKLFFCEIDTDNDPKLSKNFFCRNGAPLLGKLQALPQT